MFAFWSKRMIYIEAMIWLCLDVDLCLTFVHIFYSYQYANTALICDLVIQASCFAPPSVQWTSQYIHLQVMIQAQANFTLTHSYANLEKGMPPFRLCNRSLTHAEYLAAEICRRLQKQRLEEERQARHCACTFLTDLYATCTALAETEFVMQEKESNLLLLDDDFLMSMRRANVIGFVMVCTPLDETPKPVICFEDRTRINVSSFTYRDLYAQLRVALKLRRADSLRLCSWRPWLRYAQCTGQIPERLLLPSHNADARNILGTTLFYYAYVKLRDEEDLVPDRINCDTRFHTLDEDSLSSSAQSEQNISDTLDEDSLSSSAQSEENIF